MTIYEVFYDFFAFLFPTAILTSYSAIIELNAFIVTLIFVYGFILIPLWKIGTFFHKKGRR